MLHHNLRTFFVSGWVAQAQANLYDDLIMDTQQLIDIARDAFGEMTSHDGREKGFVFRHGLAVGRLAVNLAHQIDEPIDVSETVLFAGGLFHDCAKDGPRHSKLGAKRVRDLLADVANPNDLEAIAHLVKHHNDRGKADHATAVHLIQDADVLDHFGAQNIWLAIYHAATHQNSLAETIEFYRHEQSDGYHRNARDCLNFDISRQEIDRRIEITDAFYNEIEYENDGELNKERF